MTLLPPKGLIGALVTPLDDNYTIDTLSLKIINYYLNTAFYKIIDERGQVE